MVEYFLLNVMNNNCINSIIRFNNWPMCWWQ